MNEATITRFPKLDYSCNEAMNTLATNISYCGDDIKVIELTSRYQHEGKSYIAMNLLRTFTSFGKTVVLLDADLRRSSLISKYGIKFQNGDPNGLAQYLAGRCTVSDIVYQTDIPGAYIIPTGRLVSNSLQLIKSPRFAELIDTLAESSDLVLIDTPPAGLIVDAVEISKSCDGALIVVDCGEGHKREIADINNAISRTGCTVLGTVINAVDMSNYSNRKYYYSGKYYHRYYGGYGSYGYYKKRESDQKDKQDGSSQEKDKK